MISSALVCWLVITGKSPSPIHPQKSGFIAVSTLVLPVKSSNIPFSDHLRVRKIFSSLWFNSTATTVSGRYEVSGTCQGNLVLFTWHVKEGQIFVEVLFIAKQFKKTTLTIWSKRWTVTVSSASLTTHSMTATY